MKVPPNWGSGCGYIKQNSAFARIPAMCGKKTAFAAAPPARGSSAALAGRKNPVNAMKNAIVRNPVSAIKNVIARNSPVIAVKNASARNSPVVANPV